MLKSAIIGAGYISRQHIRAVQALQGVDLAGVCDLSPSIAAATAEQFHIAKWYTSHRQMLDEVKPDITHITTPIASHLALACDALSAGSHVLVEKPIAGSLDDWEKLRRHATECGRNVLEDHNYRFNRPMRELFGYIDSGKFGRVIHVEIAFCLDISDSVFADRNLLHETLSLPGGAIQDFLPHMAYLTNALIGKHRKVATLWHKLDSTTILPHDEFRALVDGEAGTASLVFSSHSQPDGFWVNVWGSKMQARINLLEDRITTLRLRSGAPPLMHLANGRDEGKQSARAAWRSLMRKLSGGPASYDGLFELIRQFYQSTQANLEPPVTADQIDAAQRLVNELVSQENRI